MTMVETRAPSPAAWTPTPTCMSLQRLTLSEGSLACTSSPPPRADARLLGWLSEFGTVALVGIEGTGSYGAGLARHSTAAGVRVVEVDRSDRQCDRVL